MSDLKSQAARPSPTTHGLGRIGIWSRELRFGTAADVTEAAAALDELGFGAIWVPDGVGGDLFSDVSRLLDTTQRIAIGTGALNISKHDPADVGAWWRTLSPDHQARAMIGLGVSHAPAIGGGHPDPFDAMNRYFDGLDAAGLPRERRCLVALGPQMIELARDRAAGTSPFLVTARHTAEARATLSAKRLLAPEQGVILETDAVRAREIAREGLAHYLHLPNYLDSWRRQGFSEEDISRVSDRLVDDLFAWGTPKQITARVEEHFATGANHVCLQVVRGQAGTLAPPIEQWRMLAEALL